MDTLLINHYYIIIIIIIKYHHCEMYKHTKSQFTRDFNLSKALLHLTDLTFQDSLDYENC